VFFLHFFINKNGLRFQFFSYFFFSDPGDNSDILSTCIKVSGVILDLTLNLPFRPSYGHFTNKISLFPLTILLIFSPRGRDGNHKNNSKDGNNNQSLQQQAQKPSYGWAKGKHAANL
jgi:hypothetical protein